MPRRIVGLSVALEAGIASDPPGHTPEIACIDHRQSTADVVRVFPGLATEALPGAEGWAIERRNLSTHTGTHLDAPCHFHSTMDGGQRACTIDEVPLDWCFGRGVKLDFRHLPDGHVLTAAEVAAELARVDAALRPFDIVLVNTAASTRYGQPDYASRGCGLGRDATLYLTERGVRVCGTDAWSWDAPFVHTARRYAETKDAGLMWEGHRAGMVRANCHIEKLAQLEQLLPIGFQVACFPFKIKGASAGFTRAVAIFEA